MSIAPASSGFLAHPRTVRRAIIVGVATAAAMLLFAGPALAHITVSPTSAPAGSSTELTFRVPNEEPHADTVKVDIQIPTDHPIAQLLVKPITGWTSTVTTIKIKPVATVDGTFTQAVSEVIWSGGRILPGQFQDFAVSAYPLPSGVRQIAFKALQTYSNGDIVRWIDLPKPGLPAARPAPILTLTTTSAAVHASAAPVSSGTNGLFPALAVAGLLVGLLASLLALTVARQTWRLSRAEVGGRAPEPAPSPSRTRSASRK